MSKITRMFLILTTTGLVILMATTAFAKTFSLKDAGMGLWVFVIIGAVIILLQLIPAAILFFSFIGSASTMAFKRKKVSEKEAEEKEKLVLSGYEPVTAEK
ncbi:MAG: hypothetical protein A2156_04425 [Deltaproteobacteria bacterium RBG_16_48_10]|nr:MAG: hypothetical protein A2156_04425 [Deltaproteobacteria bacterium RBG_16_48_10]